jgi:predicted acetyltransferase
MSFEIRTVKEDEFVAWQAVMAAAFFSTRSVADGAVWKRPFVDLARCWAAFDGDEVVGTFRTFDNQLTVPGGAQLPVDAVTNVTVRATHRRRGALTGMMHASLAAAAERGDPLSILIAARWPIYGRFGYGPGVDSVALSIDNRLAAFRTDVTDADTLQYVDAATARAAVDAIFDRSRLTQVGAIQRQPELVDLDFNLTTAPGLDPWKGWCVLHRDPAGTPDGYLRYHVEDKWDGMETDCILHVDDLIAATPDAYAGLWRFCCEMDNIRWVKSNDRSADEPLPWLLTDARAVTQSHRTDFVWIRPLDVPAALSGRRYVTDGGVVLDVVDPLGYAQGRFALEGGPGGATCTRTDKSAELELSAFALGAAYLGGVRLRELAAGGLVTEISPGALARADAMFQPEITPWCNTWF